jgi:hypothetical protein
MIRWGQNLDRDLALQLRVGGPVDLTDLTHGPDRDADEIPLIVSRPPDAGQRQMRFVDECGRLNGWPGLSRRR